MAIIFADDDDFVRDFAESMLESITSDLIMCEDGHKAIQSLQKRGPAVKLVILDLNMPGVDGFTACQNMRAAGYKIPIIGFSADNDAATKSRVIQSGFTGLIHKPLVIAEVLQYYR